MAVKTSVDGNRVTIDDYIYTVTPAGPGQYAVADEFGGRLGYFTVRGRVVTPDDYGVQGAHPVLQIGKLWAAAHLFKPTEKAAAPATKGLCRIATHERASEADLEKARAYRAWMKKQPGCKASYFVLDPATGKGMSISIWETREHLNALREMRPPEGATPLQSTSVESFPIVEEP
ncbi:hypothetical protein [Polyangium aurulentum]|uniref:hypothetical protein n=1 Tax=Polyangium aurulentum TaxID=2567896 RepID=UPI0010AE420A|nr:hypothetical protein [Polyangium aurulentum]UQA56930.1 hypothetical protein E8A73_037405 [Polyangium aurulentum]